MRTIYKYPLAIVHHQIIPLPIGYKVIHVGVDPTGQPCVWAEVENYGVATDFLNIWMCGTGHAVPTDNKVEIVHRMSFNDGPFVWHVYMMVPE